MNPHERFHAQVKASAQKAEEKYKALVEPQKPWWKKAIDSIKLAFAKCTGSSK
jgi:hypothetical protein